MIEQYPYHEKIVLVGGGSGVARIAKFLKQVRPNITTIQTVFDYGRHSAKLRDERGMLPPGDIRQAILALSDDSIQPILRDMLSFRFSKCGSSIDDATLGNFMLTALTEMTGSLPAAISAMCQLYQVTGEVLPVSLDDAHLVVKLDEGTELRGEGAIDTRSVNDDRRIKSAWLDPQPNIYKKAWDAIIAADKLVFCPGDFWTSLIPNVLVEGFREAAYHSRSVIMVTNLMTKKAETDGYTTGKFGDLLGGYLGRAVDFQICNTGKIDPHILRRYELEKSQPVSHEECDRVGKYIYGDFVDVTGGVVRHHQRVAKAIADICAPQRVVQAGAVI